MRILLLGVDIGSLRIFGSSIPVVISLLSLVVAVTALRIAARKPRVILVMPRRIRLEYNAMQTVFYVQPSFFVGNLTTRAAVITDMELEVRLVDEEPGATIGVRSEDEVRRTIPWWGIVAFEWSKEYQTEVFGEIKSDAMPLPITLAAPQSPQASFLAPVGWQEWLQAGRCYDLTLYATVGSSTKRLKGTIEGVYLEENAINWLKQRVDDIRKTKGDLTEEGEYLPFFPRKYHDAGHERPGRPWLLGTSYHEQQ